MTTRDLNLDGEIFSLPSTLVDAIEEAGRQRSRERVVVLRWVTRPKPDDIRPSGPLTDRETRRLDDLCSDVLSVIASFRVPSLLDVEALARLAQRVLKTRASIVAYIEDVADQQQGYVDQATARADMIYRGRLSMRAFMARALAKRVARGEDLRARPAPIEVAT